MRDLGYVSIQTCPDNLIYHCTRTFKDHATGNTQTQRGSLHIDNADAILQWLNVAEEEKIQRIILLKQYEQKGKRTIYGTFVTQNYIYNITVDSDDHKIADQTIEDITNILHQHVVVRLR